MITYNDEILIWYTADMPNSSHDLLNQRALHWAATVLHTDFEPSKEYGRDENHIHRLTWDGGSVILKIGKSLQPEADRLQWLKGRIPAPLLLGFMKDEEADFLLMSTIVGVNACTLSTLLDTDTVVAKLAEVIRTLHTADTSGCPFGEQLPGNVLTHGDACLPNFMFLEDGTFSGYIDLGDLAVAPKEVDLSATAWSLQYNFGLGFGLAFLEEYGIDKPDDRLVADLVAMYEENRL